MPDMNASHICWISWLTLYAGYAFRMDILSKISAGYAVYD